MTQDLRNRMEKMQEMLTKDLEELKNKQMNNTLEGINSSITDAEEQISDLEGRMVEIAAAGPSSLSLFWIFFWKVA